MSRTLEILGIIALLLVIAILIGAMMIMSLAIPIDEGGEVSRLATAGILRNADV